MEKQIYPMIRCAITLSAEKNISVELINRMNSYHISDYKILYPKSIESCVIKLFPFKDRSLYLDEVLSKYFNQLKLKDSILYDEIIKSKCKTNIEVWVDYSTVFPALDVSQECIHYISNLNAGLIIDAFII